MLNSISSNVFAGQSLSDDKTHDENQKKLNLETSSDNNLLNEIIEAHLKKHDSHSFAFRYRIC